MLVKGAIFLMKMALCRGGSGVHLFWNRYSQLEFRRWRNFRIADDSPGISVIPRSVLSSVPKCEGPRAPSLVVWMGRETVATRHLPNNRQVAFIETTSPGLRGQSGGPIFDKEGVVWAVQSKTLSMPLGFNSEYESEGRKRQAPEQFIHVGLGTHIQHIRELLQSKNVAFEEQE